VAIEDWIEDAEARAAAVDALLSRVRAELGVTAAVDPDVGASIGRTIGARVAAVRWGVAAGMRFRVAVDPDVRAGLDVFPQLDRILTGSAAASP
jgi:hypothetical protein